MIFFFLNECHYVTLSDIANFNADVLIQLPSSSFKLDDGVRSLKIPGELLTYSLEICGRFLQLHVYALRKNFFQIAFMDYSEGSNNCRKTIS